MLNDQGFTFPFGEKLKEVHQRDISAKKAFVLGVYASAVHARWLDKDGRQKVAALAVASEPCIFWTGEDAEEIISGIKIPVELGTLTVPAVRGLNGPSGRALDELYLKPLGLSRENTWLCDLLPESRVNEQQREAIKTHYTASIIDQYDLPEANIPDFDKSQLNSAPRREQILRELESSGADRLILLGDLPVKWFLRFYTEEKFSRLSDFIQTDSDYGKPRELKINGRNYQVIPLCHPRQAARLGQSSTKWGDLHRAWIKQLNGNPEAV